MEQVNKWLLSMDFSNWQGPVALGAVLLTLFVCLLCYRLKGGDWRIRRTIKRLGPEYLANMCIPDGMDGYVYIDYVVLTQSGLKLVSVKHFDGMIYGGESLEFWRQVTPSGSYQFSNPLIELDIKARALKTLLPDVDTEKLVLFDGNNSFPKAMPANVVRLQEFSSTNTNTPIDEHLQSSWQRMRKLSFRPASIESEHA